MTASFPLKYRGVAFVSSGLIVRESFFGCSALDLLSTLFMTVSSRTSQGIPWRLTLGMNPHVAFAASHAVTHAERGSNCPAAGRNSSQVGQVTTCPAAQLNRLPRA